MVVASCPEQKLLSYTFSLAKKAHVLELNFIDQNKMAVSSAISPKLLLVPMVILTFFLTPSKACTKQVNKFDKGKYLIFDFLKDSYM